MSLRKHIQISLLTLFSVGFVACVSTETTKTEVKLAPTKKSSTGLLRGFEETKLPNGLTILYIPDQSLPYISYSILVKAGSSADPKGQEGLAAFVADMLDKGTSKRQATQIARDLGLMGADFSSSASYDYAMISASAISPQAEPLLKIFSEIVLDPSFSDGEIARVRKQTLAGIQRRVDSPDLYADLAFNSYLFGEHPYGQPITGSAKAVSGISKRNLIRHYLRSLYRPSNSILAVVGKYTPELRQKIETSLTAWENREVPKVTLPPSSDPAAVQIRLLDKPGLVQAQIHIGHLGIKRADPDFLALRVANTILGGAFASRLNDRIRKELGLTYSIGSSFDARQDVGPFVVETFTKNSSVGQTISETLKVLNDYYSKGASAEEVARAKGYLKGVFPASIESAEKLAYNLLMLRLYGISDNYLTDYISNIDDLGAGDVNAAIKKHLHPDRMKVLVYTSAPEVSDQLKALSKDVEIKKATEL